MPNIPNQFQIPNPNNGDFSRIDKDAFNGYYYNLFIPTLKGITLQTYLPYHRVGIYQPYGLIEIKSAGIVPVVGVNRQYAGPVPLSMSPDYAREPNYKYTGGKRY